ncbi:MAG TPA: hypothetical protein VGB83_06515 [Actinomycetota bacterium]
MSGISPRLVKGGIVVVDASGGSVLRVIPLQYNADSLARSFQLQSFGTEGGDRSEVFRIKAPAVETIRVEAEMDATDRLQAADATTVEVGLHPQIAVLEALVSPTSGQLQANDRLARSGTLEIVPMQAPLTLFVWGRSRVLPVRITELSVTEEAFDPLLNPIRAKLTMALRVLSVHDVGFAHRAGGTFMAALQAREQLAGRAPRADLSQLGIGGLP